MKPLFVHFFSAVWNDPAFAQHALIALLVFAALYLIIFRWPVMQPVRHALWNDANAVRLWGFGLVGFVVTLASMVFTEGVDVALTWTPRQWLSRIVTSFVALALTMVNPKAAKKPDAEPQP